MVSVLYNKAFGYKDIDEYLLIPHMPRVSQNSLQDVLDIARRDNAVLEIDNLSSSLPMKTVLTFACRCDMQTFKSLKAILCTGMLCVECTAILSKQKRQDNANYIPDLSPSSFCLIVNKIEVGTVHLETLVSLVVSPEYLTKSLRGPYYRQGKSPHFQIGYWDSAMDKPVLKRVFIKGDDVDSARVEANRQLDCVEAVPVSHVVRRTIKQIVERKPFYITHFRMIQPEEHFAQAAVPLDEYMLSSWLGDGTNSSCELTNIDHVILEYWRCWANEHGMQFNDLPNRDIRYSISGRPGRKNIFRQALITLNLLKGEKHIPDVYKFNSRASRLQTLAGLIDTDGSRNGLGFDFLQCIAHERLFDDFRQIALSLGFMMTKTYCEKACTYKGVTKHFAAVRGNLIGEKLRDIPVRVLHKQLHADRMKHHDRMQFDIVSK